MSYTSLYSPVSLTLYYFLFLVSGPDAGKIFPFIESDKCSVMNALSAKEREHELVSLFTPGFRFSLLNSIAVSLSLDTVSTSRITVL